MGNEEVVASSQMFISAALSSSHLTCVQNHLSSELQSFSKNLHQHDVCLRLQCKYLLQCGPFCGLHRNFCFVPGAPPFCPYYLLVFAAWQHPSCTWAYAPCIICIRKGRNYLVLYYLENSYSKDVIHVLNFFGT